MPVFGGSSFRFGVGLCFVIIAASGCADDSASTSLSSPTPQVSRQAFKIQSFQSEAPVGTATLKPSTARLNDPSAPSDSPLCGRALREADSMSAAISPPSLRSGSACLQAACFDPLTDSFLGADGFRHICQ